MSLYGKAAVMLGRCVAPVSVQSCQRPSTSRLYREITMTTSEAEGDNG